MTEFKQEQQQLIIESLITDGELFARCQAIIKPEYFHKSFQKSVKFILEFCEKYNSVPSVAQINAACGTKLIEMEKFDSDHQEYFLDLVESFCRHQAIVNAVLEGSELIENGEYNTVESLIKNALMVGLQKDMGIDYFSDPKTRLLALKNSNGSMSTGWASLDKKLYNVNRGELMLYCAPSGGGKSLAMQNMLLNMSLDGYNCIYLTVELSKELCALRLDTMLTQIPTVDIYKNLDDVETKVKIVGKKSGNVYIKELPHGSCARDIKSYLREFKIQEGINPDVIFVDYLDLLMPNDSRISPSDLFVKDKYVSEELRALAKEFGVLCVTASQFGRSATDVLEFSQSHIAGGKSKIDTADSVIGIFSSPKTRERGEMEFQLIKTRNSNGSGQKIMMAYEIDTMRITDMIEGVSSGESKSTRSNVLDKIQRKNSPVKDDDDDMSYGQKDDPIKRAAAVTKLLNGKKD